MHQALVTRVSPHPLQSAAATGRVPQHDALVVLVHLLEEDEGEDGVRPESGVVRREALPQREHALVLHHLGNHVLDNTAD